MGALSDIDIRSALLLKDIEITPWPEDIQFQPASIDLRLGDQFLVGAAYNESLAPARYWNGTFYIEPGQFVLATTLERIRIGRHYVGQLNGKSSWGRKGLLIHATAGFVDPGFTGQLTLEMYNLRQSRIPLEPGVTIAQICFFKLDTPAGRMYGDPELGSHYKDQQGPTPADQS